MIGERFGIANRGRAADKWLAEVVRWTWKVKLYTSLETDLLGELRKSLLIRKLMMNLGVEFANAAQVLEASTPENLQAAWSHRAGGLRPYQVADLLGELAGKVHQRLLSTAADEQHEDER